MELFVISVDDHYVETTRYDDGEITTQESNVVGMKMHGADICLMVLRSKSLHGNKREIFTLHGA